MADLDIMNQYVALIHKDASSDYGVSFPDLPGCVTAGLTLDDARALAQEALSLHLEGLLEDGEALPSPSSLEDIMKVAINRAAVAFLVEARIADRSIRINVSIPESDLKEIDAYARTHDLSRSGLFLKATKLAIDENRF
jgi:predicted RNase H-like HicB family nuclease